MNIQNLKIGIHQINTVTGDIKGNIETIKQAILCDKNSNADLSIFPETAITGYMCGSLWDRIDFCSEQNNMIQYLHEFIKEVNYEGTVIIGFVDLIEIKTNGFPHLKNAAAVINKNTDFIPRYHKQLLASADHHEDKKYFDRGDCTSVFIVDLPNVGQIRVGVLICEDAWSDDHQRNLPEEMVKDMGADLLININQSYFYYGKQEKRINQFSKHAKNLKVPYISVNSVGVGDIVKNIVTFDGGSMIFNENGNLVFEAPRFKEFNEVLNYNELQEINHISCNKYAEIFDALCYEQKEFFRLLGINKAQVHISGGIDSAIVASIVYKSMGPDNVVFITNPTNLNSKSLKYVEHLQSKLNVKIWTNPLQTIFDEFMAIEDKSFNNKLSLTGQSTVQATLRTVQGLAASHLFSSGIVATGNHTEIVLGWASFHDIGSIGVHSLIGDLTKMELYTLADYINKEVYNDEIIAEDLFNGKFPAAAELPDANEDPINYHLQSGICALLIRERKCKKDLMEAFNMSVQERLLKGNILSNDLFPDQSYLWSFNIEQFEKEVDFAISKMKTSVYKAAQSAPIVIISPRSRGFSNRETLISKF